MSNTWCARGGCVTQTDAAGRRADAGAAGQLLVLGLATGDILFGFFDHFDYSPSFIALS